MACTKVLARDWTVEIYDDGAEAGEEWTAIGELNSFTLTSEKESTDSTTFDSEGFAEHTASQRSYNLTFEGFYSEDGDGVRDEGQEVVEKMSDKVGCDAESYLHLKSPNGSKEKWYRGTISLSDIGGATNDHTSWGFEFEVTGKPSDSELTPAE